MTGILSNLVMAKFDASGCPSDFLARIRKFEVDIEDKQNLIAREKQLITGLCHAMLFAFYVVCTIENTCKFYNYSEAQML